jgi:hypothetical protein
MADVVQTFRQAIANYLRGNGAPTAIAGCFVDLYNGDPQGAGSSVLSTLTGSATRPSAGLGAASAADPSVCTNASQVSFTAAASAGATVTHVAYFTAATGGSLIASQTLTGGTQVITAGNPVVAPASSLQISV